MIVGSVNSRNSEWVNFLKKMKDDQDVNCSGVVFRKEESDFAKEDEYNEKRKVLSYQFVEAIQGASVNTIIAAKARGYFLHCKEVKEIVQKIDELDEKYLYSELD